MNRINPHTTRFLHDALVFASVYGGGALFVAVCVAGVVVSVWGWRRRDY